MDIKSASPITAHNEIYTTVFKKRLPTGNVGHGSSRDATVKYKVSRSALRCACIVIHSALPTPQSENPLY